MRKHPYNLLNPYGYLNLFYHVFFDWENIPTPEERIQQLVLIGQGLVLIVGLNMLSGLLLTVVGIPFDLWQMTVGLIGGVAGGIATGVFMDMAGGITIKMFGGAIYLARNMAVSVSTSVAIGVVGGVIGGMAGGMALGVTGGLAVGMTIGVAGGTTVPFLMGFGVAVGVAIGLAYGLAVSVVIYFNGVWWAWLLALLIGGGGGFFSFFAGVIAMLFMAAIEQVWQPKTIHTDWYSGLFLLIVLSLTLSGMILLINPFFYIGPPFLIGLLFFVGYSRLFLWPFALLWVGIGWLVWLKQPFPSTEAYQQTIRWVYFDRFIFFPLPGQYTALLALHCYDEETAIQEAIKFSRFSNHRIATVSALQTLLIINPILVQNHVNPIGFYNGTTRLTRFLTYQQPKEISRLWQANQQLIDLADRLFPQKGMESETLLTDQMVQILSQSEATQTETRVTKRGIIKQLGQIVQQFQQVQQWQPDLKHVASHISLYGGLLTSLQATTVSEIEIYQAPSLPSNEATLYPAELQSILRGLGQIATHLQGYSQATAPVTQQGHILKAQEQLTNLRSQVSQLPMPARPLVALVIAHWEQLIANTGGILARRQHIGPYNQPYVIANLVVGTGFLGRDDILRQMESLWAVSGQRPSVVLYGHRRMGKSSILQNLSAAQFGVQTLLIDFNQQTFGLVPHTGALLHSLALELYDQLMAVLPTSQPRLILSTRPIMPLVAFYASLIVNGGCIVF